MEKINRRWMDNLLHANVNNETDFFHPSGQILFFSSANLDNSPSVHCCCVFKWIYIAVAWWPLLKWILIMWFVCLLFVLFNICVEGMKLAWVSGELNWYLYVSLRTKCILEKSESLFSWEYTKKLEASNQID